jgi:hypothetical protein
VSKFPGFFDTEDTEKAHGRHGKKKFSFFVPPLAGRKRKTLRPACGRDTEIFSVPEAGFHQEIGILIS